MGKVYAFFEKAMFSNLFFSFLLFFLLLLKREKGFQIQLCSSFGVCQINTKSLALPSLFPPPPAVAT